MHSSILITVAAVYTPPAVAAAVDQTHVISLSIMVEGRMWYVLTKY